MPTPARFPAAALLAAACLAVAAMPAAAAETGATIDVAAQWRALLAEETIDTVFPAYDSAIEVLDDNDEVVADACREHADELNAAAERVPLAAFVQYTAYRCADVTGDDERAERYLQTFSAVARHALAQANADREEPPIRVVAGRDIYSILEASGLEVIYEVIEPYPLYRHMVMRIATWDPQAKIERHFRFDYLDTLLQLQEDDALERFPSRREDSKRALLRDMVEGDVLMGSDWQAVIDASDAGTPQEKLEALRPAADAGGLQATERWLMLCAHTPFAGCGEGVVDALLPMAEEGHAWALAQLAVAYAAGIGVARDEAAAQTLLDRADARLPGGAALVKFARNYYDVAGPDYPAWLLARLQATADAGSVEALLQVAGSEWRDEDEPTLSPGTVAALRRQADAGSASAASMLGGYLHLNDQPAEAATLIRRAAELGSAHAQDIWADLLEQGEVATAPPAEIRRWREESARGGNADAMRRLGYDEMRAGDRDEATIWFRSAAMVGDDESAERLADLLIGGDDPGAAAQAARIYAAIDSASARQRLAMLYREGLGVAADPQRSRELLEVDARTGDRTSQALLGAGWLDGDFGARDEAQAMRWLRAGLAEHDPHAVNAYGMHLAYRSDAAGRARAVALYREAMARKPDEALYNNYAWLLCTTPGLAAADRVAGLETAKKLGDADDPQALGAGELDTVAACHAATADYARAAALQQRVIDRIHADRPGDPSLAGMRRRLQLYRDGQPYLESAAELAAAAADEAAAAADAAADAAESADADAPPAAPPQAGEDALRHRNNSKGG